MESLEIKSTGLSMGGLFLRDIRFTRRDGRGVRSRRLTM
jgi:hypothetical protein